MNLFSKSIQSLSVRHNISKPQYIDRVDLHIIIALTNLYTSKNFRHLS